MGSLHSVSNGINLPTMISLHSLHCGIICAYHAFITQRSSWHWVSCLVWFLKLTRVAVVARVASHARATVGVHIIVTRGSVLARIALTFVDVCKQTHFTSNDV